MCFNICFCRLYWAPRDLGHSDVFTVLSHIVIATRIRLIKLHQTHVLRHHLPIISMVRTYGNRISGTYLCLLKPSALFPTLATGPPVQLAGAARILMSIT